MTSGARRGGRPHNRPEQLDRTMFATAHAQTLAVVSWLPRARQPEAAVAPAGAAHAIA